MVKIRLGDIVEFIWLDDVVRTGIIIQDLVIGNSEPTGRIVVQTGASSENLMRYDRLEIHRRFVTKVIKRREDIKNFWEYL